MISHISLGTARYPEAVAFYSHVLAPLGLKLMRDTGAEAAFGTESQWCFFLYPVAAPEQVTAKGTHIAFDAPSHEHVRAVHDIALQSSASDGFSPRRRPDISATYFGAMFKDLDGHAIEVLTNAVQEPGRVL